MARFLEAFVTAAVLALPDPGFVRRGDPAGALPAVIVGAVARSSSADLGPAEDLVWPAPYPDGAHQRGDLRTSISVGRPVPPYGVRSKRRMAAGEVCMGLGLVVGLLRGCRSAGVTLVRRLPRSSASSTTDIWRRHRRRRRRIGREGHFGSPSPPGRGARQRRLRVGRRSSSRRFARSEPPTHYAVSPPDQSRRRRSVSPVPCGAEPGSNLGGTGSGPCSARSRRDLARRQARARDS